MSFFCFFSLTPPLTCAPRGLFSSNNLANNFKGIARFCFQSLPLCISRQLNVSFSFVHFLRAFAPSSHTTDLPCAWSRSPLAQTPSSHNSRVSGVFGPKVVPVSFFVLGRPVLRVFLPRPRPLLRVVATNFSWTVPPDCLSLFRTVYLVLLTRLEDRLFPSLFL